MLRKIMTQLISNSDKILIVIISISSAKKFEKIWLFLDFCSIFNFEFFTGFFISIALQF